MWYGVLRKKITENALKHFKIRYTYCQKSLEIAFRWYLRLYYYHWVDEFAGELLSNFSTVVSGSALACFIWYICYCNVLKT